MLAADANKPPTSNKLVQPYRIRQDHFLHWEWSGIRHSGRNEPRFVMPGSGTVVCHVVSCPTATASCYPPPPPPVTGIRYEREASGARKIFVAFIPHSRQKENIF